MRDGLRAAGSRLALTMRAVAAVKTDETAKAVNTIETEDSVIIRAGRPEGRWGWEPIEALMFEANLRHPLYGDKKHWYHQGWYPITKLTLDEGLDAAVEDFADIAVPDLLRETGLAD
jgi:hypothetical protein